MTLWGLGVMIGTIMGPILGGLLTEYYSWRWVFFINVPFGIATALGLVAFMDETEGNARLPFDWLGFAALGIAIGALQLMLDRGEQLGWFDSGEIEVTAAVSATALYIVLAHTLTTPRPVIEIDIFRDRNFVVGLAFMFEELMKMLFGNYAVPYNVPAALRFPAFTLFGTEYPFYRIFVGLTALALFVILFAILRGSRTGIVVRAAVQRPAMTGALGHDVDALFMCTFGLGAWSYAGQYNRLIDAGAYFSGLGFVWDGVWVVYGLLCWRMFKRE